MSNILSVLTPVLVLFVLGHIIVNIIKAAKSAAGSKTVQARLTAFEDDITVLEQDLDDARQRIEVLEKIVTDEKVTDEKRMLSDEIDGLSRA